MPAEPHWGQINEQTNKIGPRQKNSTINNVPH